MRRGWSLGVLACLLAGCVPLSSCGKRVVAPVQPTETTVSVSAEPEVPAPASVRFATRGEKTEFCLVYSTENTETGSQAARLRNALRERLGVTVSLQADYLEKQEKPCEILVGATRRADCAALTETLREGEYAIATVVEGETCKIVIAHRGLPALMCAVDRVMTEYIDEEQGVAEVPGDLLVKGSCAMKDMMITSQIPQLRDPCVLVVDGSYYAYGTGWVCWKNSRGDLADSWSYLDRVATPPADAVGDFWAPEVHAYRGAYYMFTTYRSGKTGHRGCTIMRSERPEGPFVEISNGHVTPADWDAIDGTLYLDPQGQPWMIFVHEWTSTEDGVGRMAAAKLSEDLTRFVSEPIELFRADAPSWAKNNVTDGCWMYHTQDGQLLMLWSNWDSEGYCVGIARSQSGAVEGPWTQDKELLYSKSMTAKYDGGHGMLFTAPDGQMYLSIHSPNNASAGRSETPVFIPVREERGTLVWDIWRGEDE